MSESRHSRLHDQQNMLADDFMGGSGMDRRSRKTRGALHRALISLILSRGYDEITVSDIADAANVGRSTFYLHYTDKDDLLRAGLNALKLVLEDPPDEFREDAHEPLRFSRFLTEHLFEQHHLYRTMMASRGGAIVIDSIRQAICEILRSELKAEDSSPPDEVLVQFIAGAYLAVMTWWLDRGRRAAPEEINARFMHLARGSLAVAQAGV